MYPRLKDSASIGTFEYEGLPGTHFYVENEKGDEFEISESLYNALLKADGTRALDLGVEEKRLVGQLKHAGILTTSRFERVGLHTRLVLFVVGDRLDKVRPMCRVLDRILTVAALLAIVLGTVFYRLNRFYIDCIGDGITIRMVVFNCLMVIFGYYLSICLHEFGHLIAALGNGYRVCEIGILLFGPLINGAYVAHRVKPEGKSKEEISVSSAGLRMNLLIAGCCYLLSALYYLPFSGELALIARVNIYLIGLNLLPIMGTDGERLMAVLLGVKDYGKMANKILFNKNRRTKLLHSGFPGVVCLSAFAIRYVAWLVFACVVVLSIISFFA